MAEGRGGPQVAGSLAGERHRGVRLLYSPQHRVVDLVDIAAGPDLWMVGQLVQ
ncbi:hypothetical protein M4D79_21385 [Mycolicibacterium novocastrense]|nr:hypothetical protein M4D79_21385 [Mycolicibacterium novocastrense]